MLAAMNLLGAIDHSYLKKLVMQPDLYSFHAFLRFSFRFLRTRPWNLQQHVATNISCGGKWNLFGHTHCTFILYYDVVA
jgi:hypothetical protein